MFLTYLNVLLKYDRVAGNLIMKGYFLECCCTGCSFLKEAVKESQVFQRDLMFHCFSRVKIVSVAFMINVRVVANLPNRMNKNGFMVSDIRCI